MEFENKIKENVMGEDELNKMRMEFGLEPFNNTASGIKESESEKKTSLLKESGSGESEVTTYGTKESVSDRAEEMTDVLKAENKNAKAENKNAEAETAEGHDIKNKWLSRNWSWVTASLMTAVFMIIVMVAMRIAPFGSNSFTLVDSMHQYVPFFSDFQGKIKEGGSLFYTWNVGGGQNFQSLLLYYMASPLNLLMLLCSRSAIPGMMSCIIVLKIIFSAGSFGYYLSRKENRISNNPVIGSFALGYALSSYMVGYFWNIMWLDCIMVFPLVILGYDRLIRKSDPRMYILALFYCLFTNYYIAYMICIFLVLWFLATGHKSIKKFFTDGLKFAACSILSAGMAALSLIMAYLAIMKTASAGTKMPEWGWYQDIFSLLKHMFLLSAPITNETFDGNANIYCGTFIMILIFIYVFTSGISIIEKLRKILLFAFLIISMNNVVLNFIWHGFHDQYGIPNRFSFLFIFLMLDMAYEAIRRIKKTGALTVIAGALFMGAFIAAVAGYSDMTGIISEKGIVAVISALVIVYTVICALTAAGKIKITYGTIILSVIFTAEIFTNAGIGFGNNGYADAGYYTQYTYKMEKSLKNVRNKELADGSRLVREDMVNPVMLDESSYNRMRSLGTFCSTVRGDMVTSMAQFGFYTGANEYLFDGATPVSNDILGVKYIFSRTGDYYPGANDYSKIYDEDGVKVYENDKTPGIAFGVNNKLKKWDETGYDSAHNLNKFLKLTDDSGVLFTDTYVNYDVQGTNCAAVINKKNAEQIDYTGNGQNIPQVALKFKVPYDGRFFINLRANYLQDITYILNGTTMASDRYQIQMFDLGNLKSGDTVELDMRFASGCAPSGSVMSYLSCYNPKVLEKYESDMKKTAMSVTEFTDDYIHGNVTLNENQMLFTSIPYDEGWKVYDNGKKVRTVKTAGAFLGVDIGSGVHDLEFKYRPQGFICGVIISAISWVIFVLIYVIYFKKEKIWKKGIF